MSHTGPFKCQCGQIHADQFDGPSNDLLPFIELDGVAGLNESERGASRRVFKPYTERLSVDGYVESEEDDPQLIIHIPFTSPVKIQSITIIGGGDGQAPADLRAYINHEALDFSDAEDIRPVQQWDLQAENPQGVIEYPTQFSKFQSVTKLSLFIAANHGAETTRINYIGIKGVGSEHKRRAVSAVYEVKPVPESNSLKDQTGMLGGM